MDFSSFRLFWIDWFSKLFLIRLIKCEGIVKKRFFQELTNFNIYIYACFIHKIHFRKIKRRIVFFPIFYFPAEKFKKL